jgi:hypothetical protein
MMTAHLLAVLQHVLAVCLVKTTFILSNAMPLSSVPSPVILPFCSKLGEHKFVPFLKFKTFIYIVLGWYILYIMC